MENLNAEQIKKSLECCIVNDWNSTQCNECPIYNGGGGCIDELKKSTIDLINSQEQKIFELENRLKECENGYEGTLHLERAKLHDAEEKVKELTQAHEMLSESYDHLEKTKDELLAERSRLTEENERLRAEKKTAIEDLEHCMYFAKPKRPNTCNFCTHDCEVSKDGTRCKGKEDWIYCSPVWRGFVKPKAEGE